MGKDIKGKELGKNLSQRKDGRYEAKYTDNFGKRHSIYGEKLSQVRKQLNEALYNKEHNIYNKNCQFTINEWFEIWMNTYKKNTIRITTLARAYRYYDAHIKDELGNLQINQLKPIVLQRFYNNLSKQTTSRDTVLHVHSIIKNMYKAAILNGYVASNPCDGTKVALPPKRSERRVLTPEEQELFFKYAKEYTYYDMFRLFILTGLRAGEMIALTWTDVNFKNRVLHINKTGIRMHTCDLRAIKEHDPEFDIQNEPQRRIHKPKTKSSVRDVPLCSRALEILHNLYEKRTPGNDYVFHTESGLPIKKSNIDTALDRIARRINKCEPEKDFKKFFPHTFRHTFATRCFEKGIPPKVVQKYLGHINLSTTMDLYTHVINEVQHTEIEKINDVVEI